MKIGDVVKLTEEFVTTDFCHVGEEHTVMIIDGPNEVGNIKVLLPTGSTRWLHRSAVKCYRDKGVYLKK
jgi:hypothetical protein